MKLYKNIIKIISNFIYMPNNNTDNKSILVFVLIGVVLLYVIINMNKSCENTPTIGETTETTSESDLFTNKNHENFDPSESSNLAQNTVQPVNFTDPNNLKVDVPTDQDYKEKEDNSEDDDGVLNIQGTDLLLAAAADRFYSIDVKGQSNKNASYDIRGEIPIPYNENYTPFNASHIVGSPKIKTGVL
jgi:hypothetical protein